MAVFKANRGAIGELLKSAEVEAEMLRRAKNIEAQAGEGHEATSVVGSRRARASVRTVTPEAMREEAKSHTLTQAIDAGRS